MWWNNFSPGSSFLYLRFCKIHDFSKRPVCPIKNSLTLPNCRMISKSKEFKAVGRSHGASKNCHLKTQEPVFFELNYFPFFVITMCFTNHSDREITVSLTSPVGWSAVPPQSVTWLAGCCASSGGCWIAACSSFSAWQKNKRKLTQQKACRSLYFPPS